MPNYLSRMKPNGADGTEYKLKDEELREVVQTIQDEVAGTQTATGNPITLTDGSETYAQGLSVELEPKQDLHGYDFPWVGGAGKNKYIGSPSFDGYNQLDLWTKQTETLNGHDVYKKSTAWGGIYKPVYLEVGTYTFSAMVKGDSGSGVWLLVTGQSATAVVDVSEKRTTLSANWTKEEITFSVTTAGTVNCRVEKEANGDIYVSEYQLESGNQATPFAHYSNICPISGYEGVEVEDVGFNQWDEEWEVGYIDGTSGQDTENYNSIRSKNYNACIGGASYYSYVGVTSGVYTYVLWYDENKAFISRNEHRNSVVTAPNNAKYFRLASHSYGTTYRNNISLNYPSTVTTYEPYKGSSTTTSLGRTVYGGTLNVTTGLLTVDRGFADLGDLTWDKDRTRFYTDIVSDILKPLSNTGVANIVCSQYKKTYVYNQTNRESGTIGISTDGRAYVYDTNYSDSSVTDFKTAMSGVQLVYELAEPIENQLTPQELKLLKGTNNLTTNGTTITLDYIPNNSIGDAVKASEEYTDRAVDALGDLAHINKDGSTSTKFLRGDGTWQNTGIVKEILLNTTVFQGDEVTFVPPTSYNFLVFEMNFDADGACGSAIVTDLNYFETVTIIANNTMTEHVCSLHYSSNQLSVMGSFGGDSANLRVTAF